MTRLFRKVYLVVEIEGDTRGDVRKGEQLRGAKAVRECRIRGRRDWEGARTPPRSWSRCPLRGA